MNSAEGFVLAVGTAIEDAGRIARRSEDPGWMKPQVDSSPEPPSTSDIATLVSGPSLHCQSCLSRHHSELTPRRRRTGGKRQRGLFRWMQSIGMTPNTANSPGTV